MGKIEGCGEENFIEIAAIQSWIFVRKYVWIVAASGYSDGMEKKSSKYRALLPQAAQRSGYASSVAGLKEVAGVYFYLRVAMGQAQQWDKRRNKVFGSPAPRPKFTLFIISFENFGNSSIIVDLQNATMRLRLFQLF